MNEIYRCKCGKQYKNRDSLINHYIQKKHNNLNLCPEQEKLFEEYPIDVKKAILKEDITFEQARKDVMRFASDNPEIPKGYTEDDFIEMRKAIIRDCKFYNKRIKEIIFKAKIKYGLIKK